MDVSFRDKWLEMCGIIGYNGDKDIFDILRKGLKRLEYRGYDSSGISLQKNSELVIKKSVGQVNELFKKISETELGGSKSGIAHTRWATHGKVTEINSHPHTSCQKRLAVVHNGIIENHEEIRSQLENNHLIRSETDTEIIAHYLEEKLEKGNTVIESLQEFHTEAEGTYAVLVQKKGREKIFALKNKSPLVIGYADHGNFISSDIYAFSNHTEKSIFLKDGDTAEVTENTYKVYNKDRKEATRSIKNIKWSQTENKRNFGHYMIKEVYEIPKTVEKLVKSVKNHQSSEFQKFAEKIRQKEKVVITGCGSSFHAAKIGEKILRRKGFNVRALNAVETDETDFSEETLTVAVSQSGETMDVLDTVEQAINKGSEIFSIVNVPYSTVQRKSSTTINLLAGQEICVASTKTFVNQVLVFKMLSKILDGEKIEASDLTSGLRKVIEEDAMVERVSEKLVEEEKIYVLGSSVEYPLAKELALKLKEITYTHSEGLRAGEMKHGTLALVEEGTKIIGFSQQLSQIENSLEEAKSRGAEIFPITMEELGLEGLEEFSELFIATLGFVLTYKIAKKRGLPIDKPRNLAKSVTVR